MKTNWHELKEQIYFEDGSFRDIYVFDINLEEWENWVNFVNQNYEVEFVYGETEQRTFSIDFSAVKKYWSTKDAFGNFATVKIGEININCHFFMPSEFENDISPKEFKSLDDHKLLTDYLKELSTIFNKKVLLTWENSPEFVLLEVLNSEISFNL